MSGVVCCLLFIHCCLLFVERSLLVVVRCVLRVVVCCGLLCSLWRFVLLFVACCSLFDLSVGCCLLLSDVSWLLVVCQLMFFA